jgi:hypothetical protein
MEHHHGSVAAVTLSPTLCYGKMGEGVRRKMGEAGQTQKNERGQSRAQ